MSSATVAILIDCCEELDAAIKAYDAEGKTAAQQNEHRDMVLARGHINNAIDRLGGRPNLGGEPEKSED